MTTVLSRPRVVLPPPAWRISPQVALGLIAVGAVATVGLWWNDTGFVLGLGGWLTNAGRITGLLAGYAVVVLLALMARVPALERGVGADRLARWHAMGGRYTVSLAVVHTVLIIWGYAVTAHSGVVAQTGTLITTYPDVLMATVALGLFVLVGVVSARAARRKLKYETWHFVHLYTYLAVALAFSHQFATGADFVTNPMARWAWSAMYLFVAVLLVWFRVVTPVRMLFRHRMRVVEVRAESHDVVSVYLTGHHLDELGVSAGQFFRWRFLARGLWWAANPYSLSAAPTDRYLRITVKVAGDHSAALRHLRPGTAVLAEGPYGSFTAARRKLRHVLLIGAGVGITPVRALLETLPAARGEMTFIYRATNLSDLVLRDEIDAIAAARGVQVHYVLGSRQKDPLSARSLERLVPSLRHHDVFVCGPEGLTQAITTALRDARVPARQIHTESFAF